MALFWSVGCDTGYRVSDLLPLKVSDLITGHLSLVEAKTGKQKDAHLSNHTLTLILNYVAKNALKNDSHIFWCGHHEKGVRPVTRQYVWRIIKQAGQMVGLPRLNLVHIRHVKHMRGESLLTLRHLTKHSKHSIIRINQPHLGMSKEV